MARKKSTSNEKQAVKVGLRLVPYYGITFDHHNLSGHTAVGATPEKVATSAIGLLRSRFPNDKFDVEVVYENPEVFARAGVRIDLPQ